MKNWSEKIQMIVFNVGFYEADYVKSIDLQAHVDNI